MSIYEYSYEVNRKPRLSASNTQASSTEPSPPYETLARGHCDRMIEKIVHDMGSLWTELQMDQSKRPESDGKELSLSLSLAHGLVSLIQRGGDAEHPAAVVLSSLSCSLLRNANFSGSKVMILDMMLLLSRQLHSSFLLNRMVPFVITQLSDEVAVVRSHAIQVLTQMVSLLMAVTCCDQCAPLLLTTPSCAMCKS